MHVCHTYTGKYLWAVLLKLHRDDGACSIRGDLVAGTLEAGAPWSEEEDTGLKKPKWRKVPRDL